MSTAEKLSPTIQSDFDSRPSMVRASLATACIAAVISSPDRSSLPLKTPLLMLLSRGSIYAWYSQMTRMMVPASSGVRPKIGGCGYFRSR